jgi:hypothetical protein
LSGEAKNGLGEREMIPIIVYDYKNEPKKVMIGYRN